MSEFKLKSNSFENGAVLPFEQVLNTHGCTGGNISPDLEWEGAPDNTKEFALIVHDPDAPVQNGWYHWIVLNIPPEVTFLKKGAKILPPMTEGKTSFEFTGYGGACPPRGHGIHRYNFVIYALNETIDSSIKNLPPVEIEKAVQKVSLKSAKITATYQR